MIRRCLVSAILPFVLIGGNVAWADIAPHPTTGGVSLARPKDGNTTVAMQAETVRIKVSPTSCDTHVQFVMVNSGAATKMMEVGFPYLIENELQNFSAVVDGKKVRHSSRKVLREGDRTHPLYWKVWPMFFGPNQKRIVEVSYTDATNVLDPEFSVDGRQDSVKLAEVARKLERRGTDYILRTGSAWRGPIGNCRIEMQLVGGLTRDNIVKIIPPPTAITGQTIVWQMHNFEPNRDVSIEFLPYLRARDFHPYLESLVANFSHHPELMDSIKEYYARHGYTNKAR